MSSMSAAPRRGPARCHRRRRGVGAGRARGGAARRARSAAGFGRHDDARGGARGGGGGSDADQRRQRVALADRGGDRRRLGLRCICRARRKICRPTRATTTWSAEVRAFLESGPRNAAARRRRRSVDRSRVRLRQDVAHNLAPLAALDELCRGISRFGRFEQKIHCSARSRQSGRIVSAGRRSARTVNRGRRLGRNKRRWNGPGSRCGATVAAVRIVCEQSGGL